MVIIHFLTFLLIFNVNYANCHENATHKTESKTTIRLPSQDPFRVFDCKSNVTHTKHDFVCSEFASNCSETCINNRLCCSVGQCCEKYPEIHDNTWTGLFIFFLILYYCIVPVVSLSCFVGFIYLLIRVFGTGQRNSVTQPQIVTYQIAPPNQPYSNFAEGSAFVNPPPQYTQNPPYPNKAGF